MTIKTLSERRDDATNSRVPFKGNHELIKKAVKAVSNVVLSLAKMYS